MNALDFCTFLGFAHITQFRFQAKHKRHTNEFALTLVPLPSS